MAEPKHLPLGSTALATVWSVDDAWFEGRGVDGGDSLNDRIGLGDTKSLEELKNKILAVPGITQDADVRYLLHLLELCLDRDCGLLLCNFEYFEENFLKANSAGNAVLLDVNYVKALENQSEFGVHLLARSLKGKRFRGDVFFVTAYPEGVMNLIETSTSEPDWWPIRYVPYVRKGDGLKRDLAAFFAYFIGGIAQDPIRALSTALFQAQQNGFGHPELLMDIPDDFLLKNEFESDHFDWRESFKALYHYERDLEKNSEGDGRSEKGKGERVISTKAFAAHLAFAGIWVESPNNCIFKLPVQPGMLFILWLVKFLKALGETKLALRFTDVGEIGGLRRATISIALRDPESFNAGILTGGGEATDCFRQLLACRREIFISSTVVPEERQKRANLASRWNWPKELSPRIYAPLLDHAIWDGELLLSWTFRSSAPLD